MGAYYKLKAYEDIGIKFLEGKSYKDMLSHLENVWYSKRWIKGMYPDYSTRIYLDLIEGFKDKFWDYYAEMCEQYNVTESFLIVWMKHCFFECFAATPMDFVKEFEW